ncbi:MAG: methionine--tRNA ligase [Acidiferrobacteraceae bacterium]|nr:methionine--tRNA ligase [Acidiferrobacteraceae bacterium]
MTGDRKKILMTSALPYANGPIHIGHLVEYIQTDIWSRFLRYQGHDVYYVCADDAHGTPIMLQARKEGISPEELIQETKKQHESDFKDFHIRFDNYYTTHSPENKFFAEHIYNSLLKKGHITKRKIQQLYDTKEAIFLPDRFVKGACPACNAENQYGDNCESCGSTYSATELLDAVSALSGEKPTLRDSEHFFVKLADFESMLKKWTHTSGRLQKEVKNKLNEWFDAGLRDWDISRDAPYFGFQIPNESGKYFYVWLDAPIGYMASFKNLCNKTDLIFEDYWNEKSDAELYHFVGKDIFYFHTLFWPAMLDSAGFRKPTSVFVHGFLTVDGQKMSKSRGTYISARAYLEHLDPDYLRYYFASKLSSQVEDLDLNLTDFMQKINSDLIGKVVNIASRCAGFITNNFDSLLASDINSGDLYDEFLQGREKITIAYENREFSHAMREIMTHADQANQYLNDKKPWVLAKQDDKKTELHEVCTMGLNLYRFLITWLGPVVPDLCKRSEAFLGTTVSSPGDWIKLDSPLLDHKINKFTTLLNRIEKKHIENMINTSKNGAEKNSAEKTESDNLAEQITIDEFSKIDLRIGLVLSADHVDGSEKLLKLELDIGYEKRTVFAGIKSSYKPENLIGRQVVMVANLAPRKMRFGTSEGMVLAASNSNDVDSVFVIETSADAKPGMRVR